METRPKCFTLSCRQDFWSAARTRPTLDTLQNVTLISASEMNGDTMVDFKRPAYTDDPQDVSIMVRTRNVCFLMLVNIILIANVKIDHFDCIWLKKCSAARQTQIV